MEISQQERLLIENQVRLELDGIIEQAKKRKMDPATIMARRRVTSQNYVYQERKNQKPMTAERMYDIGYHIEMVRQTSLRIGAGSFLPAQTQTGLSPLAKEFVPAVETINSMAKSVTSAQSEQINSSEVQERLSNSVLPTVAVKSELRQEDHKTRRVQKKNYQVKKNNSNTSIVLPPPVSKNVAVYKLDSDREKVKELSMSSVPNDQVVVKYPYDENVKCVGTDIRLTYTPKQMYVLRQADYKEALDALLSENKEYTLDCQFKRYTSTTFAEWAAYLRLVVQKDMRAVFSTDPILRYFFYRSSMEKRVEMFFCKEEYPKSPNQASHFGYVLYSDRLPNGKFQDIFSVVHHPVERITELETLCHMMFRIQQSFRMEEKQFVELEKKDYTLTPAQLAVLNLLRISQYKYNKVDHKQAIKQQGPMITMLSVVTSWAVSFEVESPYIEITMLNISSNTNKINIVRNQEGVKTNFEITEFKQDVAKFSYGDLRTIQKAIFTVTPDSRGPITVRVEILEVQSQPNEN